jgi:hypothetical protein
VVGEEEELIPGCRPGEGGGGDGFEVDLVPVHQRNFFNAYTQ